MNTSLGRVLVSMALVATCAAGGCSDGGMKFGEDTIIADGADGGFSTYLPWKAGNTWTYRTVEDGMVSTKVTTVGPLELVGGSGPNAGVMANKVITKKKNNTDQTISWQMDVGTKVIRYREHSFSAASGLLKIDESWDPYKLHVDLSADLTRAGATWTVTYQSTKLSVEKMQSTTTTSNDRWTVLAEDEKVTVPAGTFRALVLKKTSRSGSKTYWYVRGVGKVKETGTILEELVSFQATP